LAYAFPTGFDGAFGGLSQEQFEPCEDLLDRVEIGYFHIDIAELRYEGDKGSCTWLSTAPRSSSSPASIVAPPSWPQPAS